MPVALVLWPWRGRDWGWGAVALCEQYLFLKTVGFTLHNCVQSENFSSEQNASVMKTSRDGKLMASNTPQLKGVKS